MGAPYDEGKFRGTSDAGAVAEGADLRMRDVEVIDSSTTKGLRDVVHGTMRDGTVVLVSELQGRPHAVLADSPLIEMLGKEHVFDTFGGAASFARARSARAVRYLGGRRTPTCAYPGPHARGRT